jgi:hypothetical protein
MKTFKEFLAEDPDGVAGHHWRDVGAVAFSAFDKFAIATVVADTHDEIHKFLINGGPKANPFGAFDYPYGTEKDAQEWRDHHDAAQIDRRRKDIVEGRLWKGSKIISIWRNRWSDVSVSQFENIKKILKFYRMDPEKCLYDNGRGYAEEDELETYDQVVAMLGQSQTISKPSDKAHVMDPQVKFILKNLTADTPYAKKADIADKLGLTVAQLNAKISAE